MVRVRFKNGEMADFAGTARRGGASQQARGKTTWEKGLIIEPGDGVELDPTTGTPLAVCVQIAADEVLWVVNMPPEPTP